MIFAYLLPKYILWQFRLLAIVRFFKGVFFSIYRPICSKYREDWAGENRSVSLDGLPYIIITSIMITNTGGGNIERDGGGENSSRGGKLEEKFFSMWFMKKGWREWRINCRSFVRRNHSKQYYWFSDDLLVCLNLYSSFNIIARKKRWRIWPVKSLT